MKEERPATRGKKCQTLQQIKDFVNNQVKSVGSLWGVSDLTITGETISGSKIEMFIEGGTSGLTYRIEITINTNASQILQGDGILFVSDR